MSTGTLPPAGDWMLHASLQTDRHALCLPLVARASRGRELPTGARSRAADLTVAAQHRARLDAYVLDALRGVRLDAVPSAATA
ncbi:MULTISPECIES: hypothetical protein [Streptomyces]|nr:MULTISPECIES: hypothetical protein [Streptomyces]MDP9954293.1 hypothetical protein [Streptomyces sp. DSM 41269]